MKLEDTLKTSDIQQKVDALKRGRVTPQPNIAQSIKQWDPKQHAIFDHAFRPDKTVYYEVLMADGKTSQTMSRIEPVARIALAFQKLIVRRAVSFLFGNPVKVTADKDGKVKDAVDRILKDNKQVSHNRRLAKHLFASTEVAEYWYTVKAKKPFKSYGFETDRKVKVAIFSPLKGDLLYPYFSETGDMVAFSREYKVKENDLEVIYFETWTEDKYFRWKQANGTWSNALQQEVQISGGKIPIIYATQEQTEWEDVQFLIERLEKLLSNFGDTNDYHGSPKIAVKGEVKGFSKKGDAGGILELSEGAEADYLSWEQAPEAIKLEIENLLRMIFSLTQTPDISFDAVKGLGSAASGQSLKMLFLDAHLKVMDKMEIFDDFLQRRLNLLKSTVAVLSKDLEKEAEDLELTPEVIPFMVNDDKDTIDNLVTAVTGGIMSKESAVRKNPLVENGDDELELVNKEAEAAAASAAELDIVQNQIE